MRHLSLTTLIVLGLTGCPTDPVDPTWQPSFDSSALGWRMNIWGPSAGELYSPGGSLDDGTLIRFDGTDATEVSLPAPVPLLNWSFGFGSSDIHVVGNEGTLLHYDGTAWRLVDSPTDQDLWGVWGAAPDDVWAVGGTARGVDGVPTLLHYDGSAWTVEPIPTPTMSNVHALFKVWGSSASDVYAVGDVGIVLHFDGGAWEEQLVGAADDLVAVWGTGPNDVVAVGGRGNGIVAHFDGSAWRTESVAPLPGLNGVFMRAPGVAHIVGIRGTIGLFDTETFEVVEAFPDELLDFHSVFSVAGELHAVGGNLAVPMGAEGIAWRRALAGGE